MPEPHDSAAFKEGVRPQRATRWGRAFIRFILRFATRLVYRIHVVGAENIPISGPALLVPNHVSLADGFFVNAALPRLARFVLYRVFFEKFRRFFTFMETIPISESDPPKEIVRSLMEARARLKEGRLVVFFAEGEISRLGATTLRFKRGLDLILKDLHVPVIPVHLEGVWGSVFSFQGGRFLKKWPKRFRYPVTVTFGAPLQAPTPAAIRQAVLDLGSDAFSRHRSNRATLFDAFLRNAVRRPGREIAVDTTGRRLTYHRLLTAAALLGRRWARDPRLGRRANRRVGLLLPPSAGALIANVALAGQGMVPVNLNYTLSRDSIDAICKSAGVDVIVTAEKVREKLGWERSNRLLYLEDALGKIGAVERVVTALACRLAPAPVLRRCFFSRARRRADLLATLLFTSGSTGVPKGVMLTEGNILSNIESVSMILGLKPDETLLGVLPFFHSFGYMAALWLPLVADIRVTYHVNPLDAKTIGELCRRERVTIIMGTPTFLTTYLRRVDRADFASLRYAISGAEKLRPELGRAFEEKFGIPVYEGYGCTELSPVAALNVPDVQQGGVHQVGRKIGKIGRPIPGVSVKVVDPDTGAPLAPGRQGLLLVRGPNVMRGYLDDPEKTSEVLRDGWYVTGDIATVDEDGFIEITDRLSRFSKIGGEMIPHILIEETLQRLAGSIDRLFIVTGIPDGGQGEALAVLVAGYEGDLESLWRQLNATDLPKLWIPARNRFFRVETLPLLGSGKIDLTAAKDVASRLSRGASAA